MHTTKFILCTAAIGNDTVAKAAAQGILLDVQSFIDIQYVDDPNTATQINHLAEEEIDVIFTSQNAVISVAAMLKNKQVNWRIYCLGNKTKIAVNQLLNSNCKFSADSSEQLAYEIIKAGTTQITFFCTNIRLDTLPDILRTANVHVDEQIAYTTKETPHKVSQQYDGILFFSPSGVRSFFTNNSIPETTTLFAIGNTTAAQVKEYTPVGAIVSPAQSKEGVIEVAINFFKDKTT